VRVLVTGGRGFLGVHVCEALRAAEHEAIPLGRADGDLAEHGVVDRLLDEHVPDAVVHFAAVVGVGAAERDVPATIRDNVAATALVAQACGARGIPLAHGSTTSVYADDSVYAVTKRWSEEVAGFYCPEAALLRISWPYGPGVEPGAGRGAITNMLDQAMRGERIRVFRNSLRSWCWVGDIARAVVLVLESGRGGPWDVGREDDPRTLREVAGIACRLAGASEELIDEVDAPGAPPAPTAPPSTSALRGLGWKPEVELEDGMQRTFDWLASPRT
jgi:nucleoside-diphosphate-sugar epimerase